MTLKTEITLAAMTAATVLCSTGEARDRSEDDRTTVASLDIEYQAAVKRNDVDTMARILHPEFAMVLGDGRTVYRDELLAGAKGIAYEQQDEEAGSQVVRLWGTTAVVTAKLWVKGVGPNGAFDRRVWFSDTYVHTAEGWRYAFAQVSLPLPPEAERAAGNANTATGAVPECKAGTRY